MCTTSDKIVITPTTRLRENANGRLWVIHPPASEVSTAYRITPIPAETELQITLITPMALMAEIAAGTYSIIDDSNAHPIMSAMAAAKRMRQNLDNIINDLDSVAMLLHHATKNNYYVSDCAKLCAENLNVRIADWHQELMANEQRIAEYIQFTTKS